MNPCGADKMLAPCRIPSHPLLLTPGFCPSSCTAAPTGFILLFPVFWPLWCGLFINVVCGHSFCHQQGQIHLECHRNKCRYGYSLLYGNTAEIQEYYTVSASEQVMGYDLVIAWKLCSPGLRLWCKCLGLSWQWLCEVIGSVLVLPSDTQTNKSYLEAVCWHLHNFLLSPSSHTAPKSNLGKEI